MAESFLAVDDALGASASSTTRSATTPATARAPSTTGLLARRGLPRARQRARGAPWARATRACAIATRPSPERYLATDFSRADLAQAGGDHVQSEREPISAETALSERIMLGLRLSEGLDLAAAARELGVPAWTPARTLAAEKLVARGRLEREGDRLRVPKAAWLFADGTIAELL